jgi:hypothetical protein
MHGATMKFTTTLFDKVTHLSCYYLVINNIMHRKL